MSLSEVDPKTLAFLCVSSAGGWVMVGLLIYWAVKG